MTFYVKFIVEWLTATTSASDFYRFSKVPKVKRFEQIYCRSTFIKKRHEVQPCNMSQNSSFQWCNTNFWNVGVKLIKENKQREAELSRLLFAFMCHPFYAAALRQFAVHKMRKGQYTQIKVERRLKVENEKKNTGKCESEKSH
jgi:hypothetical protein